MTKAISRAINPHITKFLKNNRDVRQDKMLKAMVHDWISLTKEKKRKGRPKEKKRKVAKEKKRKVPKEKKRKSRQKEKKRKATTRIERLELELEYLKTRLERLEHKNSKYRKLIDWLSN